MSEKGDGNKQFLRYVSQLKESRMPDTVKKWAKLNEGYRRLLFKQAGLGDLTLNSLADLSNDQRRALLVANRKIQTLAGQADLVLIAAVMPLD